MKPVVGMDRKPFHTSLYSSIYLIRGNNLSAYQKPNEISSPAITLPLATWSETSVAGEGKFASDGMVNLLISYLFLAQAGSSLQAVPPASTTFLHHTMACSPALQARRALVKLLLTLAAAYAVAASRCNELV